MRIKHKFVSQYPDGLDTTKLQPSDWNKDHVDENGNTIDIGELGIISNPQSGEYRVKGIRLTADKKIVITYDETPEP